MHPGRMAADVVYQKANKKMKRILCDYYSNGNFGDDLHMQNTLFAADFML